MTRIWNYRLRIDERQEKTIFLKLSNQIISEILNGRLKKGEKLPSTRYLATELQINRKTVQLVYEDLEAQGWLNTQLRKGTFVSDYFPDIQRSKSGAKSSVNVNSLVLNSSQETLSIDSFDDGFPDLSLVPYELFSRAYRHALIKITRENSIGYSDPQGDVYLREEIATMLSMERFINTSAAQICTVRGSQMGIFVSSRVLAQLTPHRQLVLAIEEFTYPPALEAFKSNNYKIIKIKVDQNGLDTEHLEKILSKHAITAVYTTPHHQYPTTVTMSMERRLKLLELSKRFNFYIIEDDYDHEFHYESRPLPPLASFPHSEYVIHIGSLSKVFAPSIRLGYVFGNQKIINKITQDILLIDRQGNRMNELAIAELLHTGEMKRHIRKMRKIYHCRRDFTLTTFEKIFKQRITIIPPLGGMAVWVKFNFKLTQNMQNEIYNLGFYVDDYYYGQSQPQSFFHIRFGFASLTETKIQNTINVLQTILSHEYIIDS
ncbi:PLP-dependent aminotransferase family protein [Acinetobacter sp. B5B]|uniref:MocR-like pyridoxine biosynthesis transcription factor PdxR n=1 Tax=Acinetobacter baretiae TaxID=2605383 RepID=UPI0018C272B9|nr:PLP-dependent aminotransferase family protein [Acinetobacter baretiae]